MRVDPPERVARRIWKAVERGRDTVWPGLPERVFVLLQRLFPKIIDRVAATQLEKARKAVPSLSLPNIEH
jgi:short-subunit dehydrogenase